MISFAGVELTALKPSLKAECDRWWVDHWPADDWAHPGYLARGVDHLPLPAPPGRSPCRPGVLVWPVGASRWSVFHHFATAAQVDRIRTAVGVDPAAATLALSDGPRTVSPALWMLPPRPVSQAGSDELYLLTLVDDRYWWWQYAAAAPSSPASWHDLIAGLLTAAGVSSPSIESIDGDYSTPDVTRWAVGYQPLPLLLDAACRTVGVRLVRGTDGAVAVVGRVTAAAADASLWAAWGGSLAWGGRRDARDVGRSLPRSVGVVFPGASPAVTTVNLTDLALSASRALFDPDASTEPGVPGRAAQVHADLPALASSSDRTAYARQAGNDWYGWACALTDAVFRGLAAWGPTGLEDRVEWEHSAGLVRTRVVPPPAADQSHWGGWPDAGEDGFFARLTTASGGNWNFYRQKLSSGSYADDGAEVTGFAAIPLTTGLSPAPAPAAGMRVWVWPSASQPGKYQFLPTTASTLGAGSDPVWGVLTEATGAASGTVRQLDGSFAWSDGVTFTNVAYPVEVDGAIMTPKATANGLVVADPAQGGKYDFVPFQYADKVSFTYYPGFVSTGEQSWTGTKHFAGDATVGAGLTVGQDTSPTGGAGAFVVGYNAQLAPVGGAGGNVIAWNTYAGLVAGTGDYAGMGGAANPYFRLHVSGVDYDITVSGGSLSLGGYFAPKSSTDAAAPNGTLYYSTTAGKLVYKDSGGTVNNLY